MNEGILHLQQIINNLIEASKKMEPHCKNQLSKKVMRDAHSAFTKELNNLPQAYENILTLVNNSTNDDEILLNELLLLYKITREDIHKYLKDEKDIEDLFLDILKQFKGLFQFIRGQKKSFFSNSN